MNIQDSLEPLVTSVHRLVLGRLCACIFSSASALHSELHRHCAAWVVAAAALDQLK